MVVGGIESLLLGVLVVLVKGASLAAVRLPSCNWRWWRDNRLTAAGVPSCWWR